MCAAALLLIGTAANGPFVMFNAVRTADGRPDLQGSWDTRPCHKYLDPMSYPVPVNAFAHERPPRTNQS